MNKMTVKDVSQKVDFRIEIIQFLKQKITRIEIICKCWYLKMKTKYEK